ncbi:hypothetical protein EVAR_22824_1 [Eumeta japonica]|uniref:Uncharacterized protein n=1 Tax=Eumeta variegata TaxID=151549 RepID=A0A4C1VGA4_EUMVA|nr:hypothetical protein EVAR_22824_1 [Eumeta japonica]
MRILERPIKLQNGHACRAGAGRGLRDPALARNMAARCTRRLRTALVTYRNSMISMRVVVCGRCLSLLLGRIGRWSGRDITCSALSLARSAQAERDNESCFSCVQPVFIDL